MIYISDTKYSNFDSDLFKKACTTLILRKFYTRDGKIKQPTFVFYIYIYIYIFALRVKNIYRDITTDKCLQI